MSNFLRLLIACTLVWAIAPAASGQTYPSGKPIRIETGGLGSVSDLVSRLMSPQLSERLGGDSVIVENKASGPILGGYVAKAAPDGHTLMITGNSFWLLPLFQKDLGWDAERDFLPVTQLTSSPSVLVVHPSIPSKTVQELIAYLKANPHKFSWGSGPSGTANQLGGELFRIQAGVDIVRVPYKGVGQALNDLVGGHVQILFPAAGTVVPFLNTGRLRVLGVASLKRSALMPDVPTIAEAGLPGFQSASLSGLFTPAKTAPDIVRRLKPKCGKSLAIVRLKTNCWAWGWRRNPRLRRNLGTL